MIGYIETRHGDGTVGWLKKALADIPDTHTLEFEDTNYGPVEIKSLDIWGDGIISFDGRTKQ